MCITVLWVQCLAALTNMSSPWKSISNFDHHRVQSGICYIRRIPIDNIPIETVVRGRQHDKPIGGLQLSGLIGIVELHKKATNPYLCNVRLCHISYNTNHAGCQKHPQAARSSLWLAGNGCRMIVLIEYVLTKCQASQCNNMAIQCERRVGIADNEIHELNHVKIRMPTRTRRALVRIINRANAQKGTQKFWGMPLSCR